MIDEQPPVSSSLSDQFSNPQKVKGTLTQTPIRAKRFKALIEKSNHEISEIQSMLWSGVPDESDPAIRRDCWQLVLGYLPLSKERRSQALKKKRAEYHMLMKDYYLKENKSNWEKQILRQILLDIPRTTRSYESLRHPIFSKIMERVLFIWSVRNPASGYVQGINDLLTPLLVVFVQPLISEESSIITFDPNNTTQDDLKNIEADAYWCISKILSHIQDHYTFGQPGIQRMISKFKDIVRRVDDRLYQHFMAEGMDFLQFSFRWMNCLLMREIPMQCVIRLWDTYLAEQTDGFSAFHVYVCTAFLLHWSNQLKTMDFQQLIMFLQNVPTQDWSKKQMETLLAEAYVLKNLYHCCPNHLT